MRLRHHIRDRNKPHFIAVLTKLGITYKVSGGSSQYFDLFVFDDDARWPILRDLAKEHFVRVYHSPVYIREDITSAQWLLTHATADAGYPQPEKDFAYRSATFDLTNCCPRCSIGKIQDRPLRLTGEPKNKTAHFFSPQWEHQIILVRPEVQKVFQEEGVTGVRYLTPLKRRTDIPLTSVIQILPTTTLQPGLVVAAQKSVTCSPHDEEISGMKTLNEREGARADDFCGRVKFHVPYLSRLVHYSRKSFEDASDIVFSAEWFGSGWSASQHTIVSNKIAKIVLDRKWKGLELDPIQLV